MPPNDVETSTYDDRKRYFDSVCNGIVDKLWHHVHVNTRMAEDGTGPPVYCCGEDNDDPVEKNAQLVSVAHQDSIFTLHV